MNELVKRELDGLYEAAQKGGTDKLLQAKAVVEAARSPESPLHEHFTWDDGEAAERYRLCEARTLIRAYVTIEPRTQEPIRAYVSLPQDRVLKGGGYTGIGTVLGRSDWRHQLLLQALRDMKAWRKRYEHVDVIVSAIDAFERSLKEELSKTAS